MSKTSSYSEQQISNSTSRYNFYTGVVIAIISGVIFYESFKIPVEIDDLGVSARFFPQSISAFMGLLGLVLAVQGLRGSSVSDDKPKFNSAVFIKQVLPL
ncbi:tripartite tricarboxylate transporter TctB family protein, partial [Photobacterium sanctipauli]